MWEMKTERSDAAAAGVIRQAAKFIEIYVDAEFKIGLSLILISTVCGGDVLLWTDGKA